VQGVADGNSIACDPQRFAAALLKLVLLASQPLRFIGGDPQRFAAALLKRW